MGNVCKPSPGTRTTVWLPDNYERRPMLPRYTGVRLSLSVQRDTILGQRRCPLYPGDMHGRVWQQRIKAAQKIYEVGKPQPGTSAHTFPLPPSIPNTSSRNSSLLHLPNFCMRSVKTPGSLSIRHQLPASDTTMMTVCCVVRRFDPVPGRSPECCFQILFDHISTTKTMMIKILNMLNC